MLGLRKARLTEESLWRRDAGGGRMTLGLSAGSIVLGRFIDYTVALQRFVVSVNNGIKTCNGRVHCSQTSQDGGVGGERVITWQIRG